MTQSPQLPQIHAFITKDTPYEEVLNTYLIPSCKRLNLSYTITYVKNTGNWLKNVALKPKVILDILNASVNDVIFLDADSEIKSYPTLLYNMPKWADLAYYSLDWGSWYGHTPGKKEVLSGTLFLKNTPMVRNMVKNWAETALISNKWEQKVLEDLILPLKKEGVLKVYELPIEYCYIISRPGNKPPLVKVDNPIIVHHQISRQLKNKLS